jgi:hypothetical protein
VKSFSSEVAPGAVEGKQKPVAVIEQVYDPLPVLQAADDLRATRIHQQVRRAA